MLHGPLTLPHPLSLPLPLALALRMLPKLINLMGVRTNQLSYPPPHNSSRIGVLPQQRCRVETLYRERENARGLITRTQPILVAILERMILPDLLPKNLDRDAYWMIPLGAIPPPLYLIFSSLP